MSGFDLHRQKKKDGPSAIEEIAIVRRFIEIEPQHITTRIGDS